MRNFVKGIIVALLGVMVLKRTYARGYKDGSKQGDE